MRLLHLRPSWVLLCLLLSLTTLTQVRAFVCCGDPGGGGGGSTPIPAPVIRIEQQLNTGLPNPATVNYGNVAAGSTSTKTFTIINRGDAQLTISAVTEDGANSNDFNLDTTGMKAALAGSARTTFTVTFNAPALPANGVTAAVHIASNDSNGNANFTINVSGNSVAPVVPAPNAPDLQSGSDSGTSQTDNLTKVTNPTFDISGVVESKVELLRDGVSVAAGFVTDASQTTISLADPGPVSDGTHDYSARQTAFNVTSPDSSSLSVTIDTQAPTVTIGTPSQPSQPDGDISFTVTYPDPDVDTVTLSSSNITLLSTGTATATVGLTGSGTSYTVTLTNVSGDGALGISIAAGTATDKAGNTAAAATAYADRYSSFVVNSTDDTDDGACTTTKCTLRDAIKEASFDAGAETITFNIPTTAAGYNNGVYKITVGSTLPTIVNDLAIDGAGQNVIIDGNFASRPFIIKSGATAHLSNLTIQHGTWFDNQPNPVGGGAILNRGTLYALRLTIQNNTTQGGPGAIYSSGTLNVDQCYFQSNRVSSSGGSGGAISSTGPLLVTNSTFNSNSTDVNHGGAISSGFSTDPSANASSLIENSTFTGNETPQGFGGAIMNWATMRIVNCTIALNFAYDDGNKGNYGGGVYGNKPISVENTLFVYNQAGNCRGTSDAGGNMQYGDTTCGGTVAVAPAYPFDGNSYGYHGGYTPTFTLLPGSAQQNAGTDVTTLTSGVDAQLTSNSLAVADSSAFYLNELIQVDAEQMTVTAGSGDTLTVTRAANGTTAAAHAVNAGVNPAFDQRGQARKFGASLDVGAVEAPGPTLYVNAAVSGGTGMGDSWTNAFSTLSGALSLAQDNSSVTQIWLAKGTYKPSATGDRAATFQLKSGVAVYGGFTSGQTQLSERDANPATNGTLLSGDLNSDDGANFANDAENSYEVVTGSGTDATAVLDGFTVSGGNGDAGGGMTNYPNGSPTVTNVIFSGNSASGNGGGMFNYGSSPTLSNVVFSGNSAGTGGGMYNFNSGPTLTDVTFSGNSASDAGGGIYNSGSNATLTNVIVSGNSASGSGGGMANADASTPTLTNVTFSGNSAAISGGGGIVNQSNSDPTLRNCILWGDSNGEIVNVDPASATVSDSIVQGGFNGGTNVLDANPLFVSPIAAAAPTTTGNLRLGAGSPAVNAGNSNVANPALPDTDLDGAPRIAANIVDMGAYELIAPPTFTNSALAVTMGGTLTDLAALTGATPGAGTFSGTGVSLVNGKWVFDSAGLPPGTQLSITYTITGMEGTSNSAAFTVTVTELPSLVVTTTSDSVSNIDGVTSLREALSYAASLSGPQTITFNIPTSDSGYDAGSAIYAVKLATDGDDTFGPSGLLVDNTVTIDGGSSRVTITRDTTAQPTRLRLFYVSPTGNLTLKNVTLSGGLASGGSGGVANGAGGGGAAGLGGAILNQGTVSIIGSTLSQNRAIGGNGDDGNGPNNTYSFGGAGGGGLGEAGSDAVPGQGTSGSAGGGPNGGAAGGGDSGFGGGGGGGNYSSGSGGVGGFGGGGGGGAFVGNGANGGFGGGGGGGGFNNNPAGSGGFGAGDGASVQGGGGGGAGLGGAIFNYGGVIAILNSTFAADEALGGVGATGRDAASANGSGFGGAIFNLNGTVTATNATIAGNVASGDAGAIYNLGKNGIDTQSGPTLPSTTATVTLNNTILSGSVNSGATAINDYIEASSTSGLATSSGASNIVQSGGSFGGAANNTDPMLNLLGNNGGVTQTMSLQAASQAIDAGSNALAVDANNTALATDQRGMTRVQKGQSSSSTATVDIGAYELIGAPTFTTANTNVSVGSTQPIDLANASGASPSGGTFSGVGVTNNNGTYTFDPTGLSRGVYTITYTVSDGFGGTNSSTFTVTVAELPSLIVTATSDVVDNTDGLTSLREAISYAQQLGGSPTITFSNSTPANGTTNFYDNTAHTITLAGSELAISSNVTITGLGANLLTISGNQQSRVFDVASGVTCTISGVTIAGGNVSVPEPRTTDEFVGGGLRNSGQLTLNACSISGNLATGGRRNEGGGVYNDGVLQVLSSTVSNNSVVSSNYGAQNDNFGGGISNSGTLTMVNSTVAGNTASGNDESATIADIDGGGIYNSGALSLTNVTVTGNAVTGTQNDGGSHRGGGILNNGGTVNLRNTIIAGNTAGLGPDVVGTVKSQGYNLIGQSDGSSGFTNGVNGDQVGTSASPLDPMLGALANHGGPTMTHALLPGSVAIDAGDNCVLDNSCSEPMPSALATDQRGPGYSRKAGQHVDIGAFEFDELSPPADSNSAANTVKEGAATGSGAGLQVSATDPDGNTLSYSIISDSSNGAFAIDAATGVITVADPTKIDYEASGGSYTVIVQVSNGVSTSSQSFTIQVTDVAPVGAADSYTLTENTTLDVAANSGVLVNDADVNGGGLTAVLVSGPSHASAFSLNADGSFSYTPAVNYSGSDSFTYKPNDGTLSGNTVAVSLRVNFVAPPTPTPSPTPTLTPAATPSVTPQPTATPTPRPAQTLNLSTRADVASGDNVEIGGFIITGSAPKKVLVRAIGPSLHMPGELFDPVLELHGPSDFSTITNDDWQEASNANDIPAALQPNDPRESAILVTLDPGAYTCVVFGKSNLTGIALVEIYDASLDTPSQLANLSTRAVVQTQDKVMIGGFIVGGAENSTLIVRALGPSLADRGVPDPLANPVLDIRNKDGTRVTSNDNWKDDSNAPQVSQNNLAPTKDLESALYLTLAPGEYTAIVTGANGGTGVGLVEIYHLQSFAAATLQEPARE